MLLKTNRYLKRLLLVTVASTGTLMGQQSTPPASPIQPPESKGSLPQQEVDAIVKRVEADFVAAYNRGDANALAALYSENATSLTGYGAVVVGRARIQENLTRAFGVGEKGQISNTPRYSAAISKDIIVTHGKSHMTFIKSSQGPLDIIYTKILMRQGEKWLIEAAQYATPNPWILNFPPTAVGQSSPPMSVEFTNAGSTALTIRKISLDEKGASDFKETHTCSGAIPPSGKCVFSLTFHPQSIGGHRASLSFWDDGDTGRHEIRLLGTGQ